MAETVEVLLATYNSANYIEPMLESLIAQERRDFSLVVSDDLSRDDTRAIVARLAPRLPGGVRWIERETRSGGASANFSSLIQNATADYAFLADHDDVWLPGKIARGVARMRAIEAEVGADTPILLHGDLRVVDANLRTIAPSLWAFKAIDPAYGTRLNSALMHASVTGCTVVMNRALRNRLTPIPKEAIMHDWWLNLVAVAFGRVAYDPEPQILYRVHGANVSQPRRITLLSALTQWDKIRRGRARVRQRIDQGAALLRVYGEALPPEARAALTALASIPEQGFLERRATMLKGRFMVPGLWRNVVNLAFV